MLKMLNLQTFIHNNPNWRELITRKPYCIKVTEKEDLVCFKYSQIDSDFNEPLVRECRGIILEKDTWNVVAYPFNKFFNFGEEYADNIDWESAHVLEKVDGSLIKVYFHNGDWCVGTNNTIDANDAELSAPPYETFMELFDVAADVCGLDYDSLDPHYTYIFELRSPYNRVVVPYEDIRIVHIGTRNNITCEEVEADIGIEKPKQYMLSSLEDCIAMAKTFDFTKEGFVVKDKNYNRIKVKSEDYVRVHRLANNGSLTLERAIDLIRMNEIDEFLNYFPNYTFYINNIRNRLTAFRNDILFNVNMALIGKMGCKTRKDFAATAKTFPYPVIWFKVYDSIYFDVDKWIAELSTSKLAQNLEKK